MSKFESKIGSIKNSEEKIFNFLSNFKNFEQFVPADQVKNWEATEDECEFSVNNVGEVGLKIVNKEPYKLVKISTKEVSKFTFNFWIQLKQVTEKETRIKLTMDIELNPMLKMVASGPIKSALDTIVDRLGSIDY